MIEIWGCCALLALGAMMGSSIARADDPLGIYAGAALGQSHSSEEDTYAPGFVSLRSNHFGAWSAFVGARPLSVLGVDLKYIDFGNTSPAPPSAIYFGSFDARLKQSATVLYGVGYLPLPVPFLSIYGKLGVARLRSDAQESYLPPTCPVIVDCDLPYTVRQSQSSTDLAYGAGAQTRYGPVAVRVEYERVSSSGGSPELFSLGVAWVF